MRVAASPGDLTRARCLGNKSAVVRPVRCWLGNRRQLHGTSLLPAAPDPEPMRIARNAEPASWIAARLHSFAQDVGSVIPEGFAAYARVFHPPYRITPDGNQIPVRWKDIAAANN